MSARRADTSARRGRYVVVGASVLAAVLLVALVLQRARSADPATPGTAPTGASAPGPCPACVPTPDRPGPAIDLGVQASRGDRLEPVARVEELVGLAQQAGASVISTVVRFDEVQPVEGGPMDFGSVERTAAAAEAAGLDLRVTAYGLPAWAYDDGRAAPDGTYRPPRSSAELTHWRALLDALVRRLRPRLDYLEVWNEPNIERYWSTGPDPAELAALLEASESVARAAAPDVRLVSGGIAGNDLAYLRGLGDALGDATPYDLLGLHPFTDLAPDEASPVHHSADYDDRFLGFTSMLDTAREQGHARPAYITSFGYEVGPELTDDERAAWLREALGQATAHGDVAVLSWYYLHPTPWDSARWTLLDRRLRPSASYDALRAWTQDRDRLVGEEVREP